MADDLEKKLQDIIAMWEADDKAEAGEQLESDKDSFDLAQPKTWAAKDLGDAFARAGAPPHTEPDADDRGGPSDNDADNAPPPDKVAPQSPPSPGLVRKNGTSTPASGGPAPPVESLDWRGLKSRLDNAQLRAMQTRAGEQLRANIIPGYKPDLQGGEAQVDMAMRPLQLAKEKQGFEQRDRAAGVRDAMDNPNSLQSQKAREAIRTFFPDTQMPPGFDNWSANEVQRWTQTLAGEKRAAAAAADDAYRKEKDARAAATHAKEREQDLSWRKTQHEDSMENAAATRALAASAQSKLPAGEAVALGGADAAVKAVDALSSKWDQLASDVGSGVKQFVPGTDANVYLPDLDTTTQVVGKYLEGGRMTDNDVPKYKRMMPQPSDTQRQKEAKISALKRLIDGKRTEESKALKGAGYRVPESDIPKTVRVRRRDTNDVQEFSPEDAEKLLQNPNFERAP